MGFSDSHTPRLVMLGVLVLLSLTAAFFAWRQHDALEGFDADEAAAAVIEGPSGYDRRMHVMKLFDALLRRKPSSDELERFTRMDSEASVLQAVLELKASQNADATTSSEKRTGDTEVKHVGNTQTYERSKGQLSTSVHPQPKGPAVDDTRIYLQRNELLGRLDDISELITQFRYRVSSL